MSFAIRENGVIDELIVEKIMLKLLEMRPLTNCCTGAEFRKAIALTRICDDDVRAIEKFLSEKGLIKRSGKNIYFDGKIYRKNSKDALDQNIPSSRIVEPSPSDI
jgi:hypothetical protein